MHHTAEVIADPSCTVTEGRDAILSHTFSARRAFLWTASILVTPEPLHGVDVPAMNPVVVVPRLRPRILPLAATAPNACHHTLTFTSANRTVVGDESWVSVEATWHLGQRSQSGGVFTVDFAVA